MHLSLMIQKDTFHLVTLLPFHLFSVSCYYLFTFSPFMCSDRSPDIVCKQQLEPGGYRGHFPVPLGWLPKTGSFPLPGGKVCAGVRANRSREDSHCRSSCSCGSGQVCTAVLRYNIAPFSASPCVFCCRKSPDCMLHGYMHILTTCAVRQQCVHVSICHSLLNSVQEESC